MKSSFNLFAACLPGLEALLRAELGPLGASRLQVVAGGVQFQGDLALLYRVNLCSGLASQVLIRLARFRVVHLAQLQKLAEAVAWEELFEPGQSYAVRAVCRRSKLYHSGAVAQRVVSAIAKRSGAVPVSGASGAPDDSGASGVVGDLTPVVAVRLFEDTAVLSLDTSGEPLHRRGWRLESSKAPLREDLARAQLLVAGWNGQAMLVDPMMGSGTLLIEAALLARGLPPGGRRSFAFQRSKLFDAALFESLKRDLEGSALPRSPVLICGSDRDAGALQAAQGNAARAGVLEDLRLECAPLRGAPVLSGDPPPEAVGWLVSNPPHGRRIGDPRKLRNLYQALGQAGRRLPAGWTASLCVADRRLALSTGWPLSTGFLSSHGGVKIRVMVGRMAARADTPDDPRPVG